MLKLSIRNIFKRLISLNLLEVCFVICHSVGVSHFLEFDSTSKLKSTLPIGQYVCTFVIGAEIYM